MGIPSIGDEQCWENRNLGQKPDDAIAAIESNIENNESLQLSLSPTIKDAPEVNLEDVQLANPPDYSIGDEVCSVLFLSLQNCNA